MLWIVQSIKQQAQPESSHVAGGQDGMKPWEGGYGIVPWNSLGGQQRQNSTTTKDDDDKSDKSNNSR